VPFFFLERKETKVRLTSSTTRDRAVRRRGGRGKKKYIYKWTHEERERERELKKPDMICVFVSLKTGTRSGSITPWGSGL
jgi:hypothetical protein